MTKGEILYMKALDQSEVHNEYLINIHCRAECGIGHLREDADIMTACQYDEGRNVRNIREH